MKKTILILISIISIYIFIGSNSKVLIPDEALRVRVIANSNDTHDQYVKGIVKENLSTYLYNILKDSENVNSAKKIINTNLDNINSNVHNTLQTFDSNMNFEVNFGLNYFPNKEYKGVSYDEGYYESLVVTLGKGKGDNWWCVMFPPLCLLEAEESDEVEYKSFVKELIDKYF